MSWEWKVSAPWQVQPTYGHTASLPEVKDGQDREWSGGAMKILLFVASGFA